MQRSIQKLPTVCRNAVGVSERSKSVRLNRGVSFHCWLIASPSVYEHNSPRPSYSYSFGIRQQNFIRQQIQLHSYHTLIPSTNPSMRIVITPTLQIASSATESRRQIHSSTPLYLLADDHRTDKNSGESEVEKEQSEPPSTEKPDDGSSSSSEDASQSTSENETALAAEESTDGHGDGDDGERDDTVLRATDVSYAFTPPPPLSQESMAKVDALLERILWLDMIEVHLLTQLIHEKLGVSWQEAERGMTGGGASFGAAAGANASGDGEADQPPEAKTVFDLKLIGFDAKAKIKVIKEVRTIAGLGLKEAKELVESAPKIFQKDLKKDRAEELKAQLEAVGAEVELV